MPKRNVDFSIHPFLLSENLGRGMYKPQEALKQLVANALDSGSSEVNVDIEFTPFERASRVTIRDNGVGITPQELSSSFGLVGFHPATAKGSRDPIGSRGIGRFAIFALGASAHWVSVAQVDGVLHKSDWTMVPGQIRFDFDDSVIESVPTGTEVSLALHQNDEVDWVFSSVRQTQRLLFNAFVGYLIKYHGDIKLVVNGKEILVEDYVDERETEILGSEEAPLASMLHVVLSKQVDQSPQSLMIFAAKGTTISQHGLTELTIPGQKYLGIVDSSYLSDLSGTGKDELPEFDPKFRELRELAISRSKAFIDKRQAGRMKEFLDKARSHDGYPYKEAPSSPFEAYRQQLYDAILVTLEDAYGISKSSAPQLKLVLTMMEQLLQSEDLAQVLTNILGLEKSDVSRFAKLLKTATLSSIISVAQLLVDRIRFLDELTELVYGDLAPNVKERSQLHKIVEQHTWLFGEQYHLLTSDRGLSTLFREAQSKLPLVEDESESLEPLARDIPDLYLAKSRRNVGGRFVQHLVVEMKRPSVKLRSKHVDQLRRYAQHIATSQRWDQRRGSHRFTFVVISAEIGDEVPLMYQSNQESGLLGTHEMGGHNIELWALRWADYIGRRKEELEFLSKEIEVTAEPELLEYLQEKVGEHLPPAQTEPVTPLSQTAG